MDKQLKRNDKLNNFYAFGVKPVDGDVYFGGKALSFIGYDLTDREKLLLANFSIVIHDLLNENGDKRCSTLARMIEKAGL